MNSKSISQSFTDTLKNDDLTNLTKDGLELTIDSFIDDDIIKQIPFVKSIAAIVSTAKSINNYLFVKKIIAFLKGISDIPQKKRQAMISKIDGSQKYRQKVGEFLLFQINHCDDNLKAEYLSQAFRAVINEELSYDDFIRVSNVLNRLSIIDFEDFITREQYGEDDSLFIGCGLLFLHNPNKAETESHSLVLSVGDLDVLKTPLGNTIKEIFKGIIRV